MKMCDPKRKSKGAGDIGCGRERSQEKEPRKGAFSGKVPVSA